MKVLSALSPRGGEVQGTYGLFGFRTIEEELTYIAILSVILVILLICGQNVRITVNIKYFGNMSSDSK